MLLIINIYKKIFSKYHSGLGNTENASKRWETTREKGNPTRADDELRETKKEKEIEEGVCKEKKKPPNTTITGYRNNNNKRFQRSRRNDSVPLPIRRPATKVFFSLQNKQKFSLGKAGRRNDAQTHVCRRRLIDKQTGATFRRLVRIREIIVSSSYSFVRISAVRVPTVSSDTKSRRRRFCVSHAHANDVLLSWWW